jgi:shikimate dehydrogenase
MMRAAFHAAGLGDWDYRIRDVPPAELAGAVAELRGEAYAGANVTIPHKVAVMEFLDEVDDEARALGAVNTISKRGGRLTGANTDVVGLREALAEVGVVVAGTTALVLGAGGSARAAAAALAGARITFVARRPAAAGPLQPVVAWSDPAWHALAREADVLVNATPLGRRGENPLPASVEPRGAVVDLVYVTGGTPLVRRARELALRCADGWSILVGQGAAAFTAWTGRPAPREVMRSALST